MPPKKAKKSKAEIERERLEAEEEERERRLAEEERLRLIQEEAERKRVEECNNYRNNEVEELVKDYEYMNELLESSKILLRKETQRYLEDEEWARCLNCNNEELAQWPGVNELELNAYISLMEDARLHDFQGTAELAECVKRLIDEIILNHLSSGISRPKAERSKCLLSFIAPLQALVRRNIDNASSSYILNREKYAESDGLVRISSKGARYGMKLALLVSLAKKGARPLKVNFEDVGISIDIPKNLVGARVALRLGYFPLDYANLESDVEGDLMFVSGTFDFDVLDLSPSANKVGQYTIRQIPKYITTGSVLRREYPVLASNVRHTLTSPQIKCHIVMPHDIVIDSNCHIAKINKNSNGKWTNETLCDSSFDETSKILSFSINSMGIYALLQSRCTDYCYREWSVSPTSSAEIIYSIKTQRFLVKFVVQGPTCRLISPDLPELSNLTCDNQAYHPAYLLGQLSRRGIHLMPSDRDAKALNLKGKDAQITNRVHKDISMCAFSFNFRSSKYNELMGEHKACFQAVETGIYVGVEQRLDDEYHIFCTENDTKSASAMNAPNSAKLPEKCGDIKCSLVRGKETASNEVILDTHILEGMRSTLQLFPSLQQISTPESSQRIVDGCPLTSQTLNDLLSLTKPIDFTSVK
eukprot:CAMPEP_0116028262 /NCGR_PEP_ID=MMETSP0321-20121206/15279_1 /TAXON_ID=163516 /ORGANISM="Leptocylindrus danicus var. danicus, Strain B650" /LENGTH=644 /DNA_ID=CAMNT_0003502093 /DNA_START=887 /DNA_END=2821 /DNA_ORIENTATION=+